MYFTKEDLRAIILWAIYRTSRSLGIISFDDEMEPQDAVAAISASKGHLAALEELAKAYGDWYAFHLAIYKSGKSAALSRAEADELEQLILRRDQAKQALLAITPL